MVFERSPPKIEVSVLIRLIKSFGVFFCHKPDLRGNDSLELVTELGVVLHMGVWFAEKTYMAMAVQAVVGAMALELPI